MSSKKEVATQRRQDTQAHQESEFAIRPAVDIFEDATGITLQADMPGVARERLVVQTNGDKLAITGNAEIDMPEGMDALHAEVRSTHYHCSFALSKELDRDNVEANLKDGVLTLRIPKREEHQPRKIEVRAG